MLTNQDEFISSIAWSKVNNLLPVIVQDYKTSEVLMLGYMNEEALRESLKQGRVVFYSRTKQRLWLKGEESGHYLNIVEMGLDCDKDTLLVFASPVGATCHTGSISCFEETSKKGDFAFLSRLERLINSRKNGDTSKSYTSELFAKGTKRIAQKVGEEGVETALAAVCGDKNELLNEGADLLFHLCVLLADKNVSLNEIIAILKERNAKKE